jgi:tRNA(Ile)-lysidine synthase
MVSSKIHRKSNLPISDTSARIAVAFSGGLDSTVLLHSTVAAYGPEHVIALHVNHSLQDISDDWVMHCAKVAESFEVPFDFRILNWDKEVHELSNIEAQARQARYHALAQMCDIHGVTDLLLGHHQDDQAETILLQLLRGSGLPGLSGMAMQRSLEATDIRIWRPFIDLTRKELESYAQEYHLKWIEDPSNQDENFTRNFIRLRILPILEKVQPSLRNNLSRVASHLAEAQHLLDQLADIDLQVMSTEDGLNIISLIALRKEDTSRANNALRRWIFLQGLGMPSEERINAWWRDLEQLRDVSDHQLQWVHDGKYLRVWRQILSVHHLQSVQGHWIFKSVDETSEELGLANDVYEMALAKGAITEKERSGGEKIRIHPQQSRKTLKKIFQELEIAPWLRSPKILCLDDEVLAVNGVGLNVDLLTRYGPRVKPVFVIEASPSSFQS